jgi:hypothetical protein
MTEAESKKYLGPRDVRFDTYKRQNKCMMYTIYVFTAGFNWKFSKLYYSFFYDLKHFQAYWTRAKYYRKLQTGYQIAYLIAVDLALVCINITALTQIEQGNQLFICLQEVLILSILSIILGSVELWLLKALLRYTEPHRDKSVIRLHIDSESSDAENLDKKFDKKKMAERRKMMDGLLKQVKHNKQLFLNNKLDVLIHSFGDRRCKSMHDLGTGWDLVDDPQIRITYPVSPQCRDDYLDLDVKFKESDAYGHQKNNVFADGKQRFVGAEESTNIDLGYAEYQDALAMKHNSVFAQTYDQEFNEKTGRRGAKKRGRKNKFHT